MRIEQLQYLAAVTQHGSLRRASERLHLDRRRSGARISRDGRELLQHMVEVLEASTASRSPPVTAAPARGRCGWAP